MLRRGRRRRTVGDDSDGGMRVDIRYGFDVSVMSRDESGLAIDVASDERRCSRMASGEKTEVAFCRTFIIGNRSGAATLLRSRSAATIVGRSALHRSDTICRSKFACNPQK